MDSQIANDDGDIDEISTLFEAPTISDVPLSPGGPGWRKNAISPMEDDLFANQGHYSIVRRTSQQDGSLHCVYLDARRGVGPGVETTSSS